MGNYKTEGNRIIISGDISVGAGVSFLNHLRSLHPSSDSIIFDLKDVTKWDSATFQLFLSFVSSHKKKKIVWKDIPERMKQDLDLAGILSLFNGETNV